MDICKDLWLCPLNCYGIFGLKIKLLLLLLCQFQCLSINALGMLLLGKAVMFRRVWLYAKLMWLFTKLDN